VVVKAWGLRRCGRKFQRGERQAFEADRVSVALFFLARHRALCCEVCGSPGWPGQVRQGMRVHFELHGKQRKNQYEQQCLARMNVLVADATREATGVRKRQDESTQPGAGPGCGCGAGHRRILG
jgi:hypothetical protein